MQFNKYRMSRMRMAVVGGGVSGLAAAYVLAKDGAEAVSYTHLIP